MSALLPDSSVIHPDDPSQDGRRMVVTCGAEHLDQLIVSARRDWVDEQLWFGRLCRASMKPGMRHAELSRLGLHARLSAGELRRALEWNARSDHPRTTLPGGQPLPVVHPPRPSLET
jgi:hypothetical protein